MSRTGALGMSDEPLLLIAFNRPDQFAQLLGRLRDTEPSRVYVAVDGPRAGHPTDAERVRQTRDLVGTIDWPCEVATLFRESNLGCGVGVSSAVTWFLEHEERGIILEDDILPQPTFFDFCSELLDRYEDDDRVMAISGCNFVPPEHQGTPGAYRFSRVPHIWGWATWRRAWGLHDLDISDWHERMTTRQLWNAAGRSPAGFVFWRTMFDLMARNGIDTWDMQLVFISMEHEMLTATSNVNLVDNVGWGSEATHTGDRPGYLRPSQDIALPTQPVAVQVDERADAWSRRVVFGATTTGLMRQTIRYVRKRLAA